MKYFRFLLIGLLFLSLTACASEETSSSSFDAKAFTETLLQGDASSLYDKYEFTEELKDALGDSGLQLISVQLEALGDLEVIEEVKVTEAQGYTVYSVPCRHTYQNFDLVISIDQDGKIAGIVMGNYSNSEASDLTFLNNEEISFGDEYLINGTLTTPKIGGPFPYVILLSGSGPNDRDETIGPNKPLEDIANGLAKNGIASLRFDKRTYSYPIECAKDIYFTLEDEYIEDTIAAYNFISERDDVSAIYILGHSLGGQILPLVAQEIEVDGLIYLAAPARDFVDLLEEQINYLETVKESDLSQYKNEIARLKELDNLSEDDFLLGAYKTYWLDLLNYNQVEEAKNLDIPQFFLQGEEDYQVSMEDFAIWKENLPNATFKSYPGLTHIFTEGKREMGPNVYMNKTKVGDEVIEDIVDFINNLQ